MGIYKLLLPKMGESVSEATVTKWVKEIGEMIEEDEAIVEIATDKVDSDVPSPVKGKLIKKFFEENQIVQVGEAIALLEIEGEGSAIEEDADPVNAEIATAPVAESVTEQEEQTEEPVIEEDNKVTIPGTELLEEPSVQEKT